MIQLVNNSVQSFVYTECQVLEATLLPIDQMSGCITSPNKGLSGINTYQLSISYSADEDVTTNYIIINMPTTPFPLSVNNLVIIMGLTRVLVKDGGFGTQMTVHVGNSVDGDPLWSARFNATNPPAIVSTHLDFLQSKWAE